MIISDTFHCKRSHSGDVVQVYNSNNYLMAEYSVGTGRTSWQRVAPVSQRESVEKWLRANYPIPEAPKVVKAEVKVRVKTKRRKKVA